MNEPISLFIVFFTVLNVLACVWLMWWTARRRQGDATEGAAKEHVWDGDLRELNNPLPRWWLGLFIGTIVFGCAYLIVYPGLGNFVGLDKWTQVTEHDRDASLIQTKLEQRLSGLGSKSPRELSKDADAMGIARNLFALHCSTCHGSDARGAKGFPNLADADWLWSHDDASVYQTIAQGRHGIMPAWGTVLGRTGVENVSMYVLSLSGRNVPSEMASAGHAQYTALCSACHGPSGSGNPLLGAPNLADNTWLYGGTIEAVRETIANGRNNQMPAHEVLIGTTKTKLMTAYVLSLAPSSSQAAGQP
jgi:cytochrome c oxidase cbb3-type subunit 3